MKEAIKKVLILGSAALKIGEAGEFDYSGSQAIKALTEEGVEAVVINPNIATIQTSNHLGAKIYFLPITPYFVAQVIRKERPDGILLGFGGQTALNCGIALQQQGVLAQSAVAVLGTPIATIIDTEDRGRFVERLREIGAKYARSQIAGQVEEAVEVAERIGYPVMVRSAFSLGGLGSGVCRNREELRQLTGKALFHVPQVLIEEYLAGWKEIEYEVMRDRYDNCITVCNMENLDPMGIHTGESIVIAPSQTLSNREYHLLREQAIRVVRHLGIIGECNVQFAVHPGAPDYRIIEVNARLSRSSALASKATGYPLALIAAKISLGYGLFELQNSMTGATTAFFEPALDYVAVKIPRWDLKKFRKVSRRLGPAMKSVGEVMAIGRSFEEALQKALRMLDIGALGLVGEDDFPVENLAKELHEPTEERIFAIAQALRAGYSVEWIQGLTNIDPWYLYRIARVVDLAETLGRHAAPEAITPNFWRQLKQAGFSDRQLAVLTKSSENAIRRLRTKLGIRPVLKQIDTVAGEYPAATNYLYLTYHGQEDDVFFTQKNAVLILGSGPYRIGSSVEFDWCAVTAGVTLQDLGYYTVMVNCNPETVSTDYDVFDTLFFDEIQLETILEIYTRIQPLGVIVAMGGQIANNLACELAAAGIKILGTAAENIDRAEDRQKFSALLDRLGIDQPEWREHASLADAYSFATLAQYPLLVRPSYVLSGAAMTVAANDAELSLCLARAGELSPEYPVIMSKFLENAQEIECDGVAQNGEIILYAFSEHIENAGVHSGDATLVLPAQHISAASRESMRLVAGRIAGALQIHGPFNIQFIAKDREIKVIECNLRASRSFPFVSKVTKKNFIEAAVQVMMDYPVRKQGDSAKGLDYVGVKASQFSFIRLGGVDPVQGVEMASTGEVGCLGRNLDEAFLKAILAVGYRLPVRTILLSSGALEYKSEFLEASRQLINKGVTFFATRGTAEFMKRQGLPATVLHWPLDQDHPNTVEAIQSGAIDLVINIPKCYQEEELTNGRLIRRTAVDCNVPLITNRQFAVRFAKAVARLELSELEVRSWDSYEVQDNESLGNGKSRFHHPSQATEEAFHVRLPSRYQPRP